MLWKFASWETFSSVTITIEDGDEFCDVKVH